MRPITKSLEEYAVENNLEHLLREYSDKNKLRINEIGYDSTVKVEWICEYGHIVSESPHKRVRRGYCSVCGPAMSGSLAQCHPELIPYWSDNNKLKPDEIPPTYTGLVLWKCEHGHEWSRRISAQLKLDNCPYCEQKTKSLFEFRPELLEQWDYDRNDIPPDKVLAYSNKTCHWICENGHRYTAAPEYMMRHNTRCPTCASAGFVNPDLIAEWHPTKNGDKTPYDFSANSQKQAWFVCAECGEEYMARIAARVKRKTNKCPNCR